MASSILFHSYVLIFSFVCSLTFMEYVYIVCLLKMKMCNLISYIYMDIMLIKYYNVFVYIHILFSMYGLYIIYYMDMKYVHMCISYVYFICICGRFIFLYYITLLCIDIYVIPIYPPTIAIM